jgi:hypothetical protein
MLLQREADHPSPVVPTSNMHELTSMPHTQFNDVMIKHRGNITFNLT